jgi:hypothetical protein
MSAAHTDSTHAAGASSGYRDGEQPPSVTVPGGVGDIPQDDPPEGVEVFIVNITEEAMRKNAAFTRAAGENLRKYYQTNLPGRWTELQLDTVHGRMGCMSKFRADVLFVDHTRECTRCPEHRLMLKAAFAAREADPAAPVCIGCFWPITAVVRPIDAVSLLARQVEAVKAAARRSGSTQAVMFLGIRMEADVHGHVIFSPVAPPTGAAGGAGAGASA